MSKFASILSGMLRSVEKQVVNRMHSVRNATNRATSFLPSDAILTDCRIGVSH
ncbi:MAG: hypothetical protein LBE56_08655 [Tannerella sp.]|nr:hypothetical protein [Tannerella sp.]